MRSLLRAAALSLAALAAVPAQGGLTLDPGSLRQIAVLALEGGDAARAQGYADALLARDPQDLDALLLRARAARDLGQTDAARRDTRAAWRLAQTDVERYSTALITAQVLSSEGKRTRAQLWLRRAAQYAPTAADARRIAGDFRYLRQRNPWQTHLAFTLAPSSNVNNGSASDRSTLLYQINDALFGEGVEFELKGASRALSGLEIGAGLRSRYRFHETYESAHDLRLTLSFRSYVLSDSARAMAPDVSGSDFAFGTVGLGYGYRRLTGKGRGELVAGVDLGQSWYGGARYAAWLRGSLAHSWKMGEGTVLSLAGELEQRDGSRAPDGRTLTLSTGLHRRLPSGGTAFARLGATTAASDDAAGEFDQVELRGGLTLARPVLGADIELGLGVAWRDYDTSPHSPQGRQDRRLFGDVTATFSQIDYYGFNPSLTLSASSTDSNIGLYETERLGLQFGIRSAF